MLANDENMVLQYYQRMLVWYCCQWMGRGTVNASKVWKYGTSAVRMKSGRYENLQSSYMPGGAW